MAIFCRSLQPVEKSARGRRRHVWVVATRRKTATGKRGGEERARASRRVERIIDERRVRRERRRTPAPTGPVRRDAVARPELAGREVRVSGAASLVVAVAQLARAHAAVAHGDCARDLYASTRAALGRYGLVRLSFVSSVLY